MSFELRSHTADVAVAATGHSLGAVFGAAADGLAAATCEEVPPGGELFDLTVEAETPEALLFDYLDELIYRRDVDGVLPVENRASVAGPDGGWTVRASARGVPLGEVEGREVKAVTYSEMRLERDGDGWCAYVVFDV